MGWEGGARGKESLDKLDRFLCFALECNNLIELNYVASGCSAKIKMAVSNTCVVCSSDIPNSRHRRRLFGVSTAHVLPVLQSLSKKSSNFEDEAIICRDCLRDAEKLLRLRRELAELETRMRRKLEQSSSLDTTPTRSDRKRMRSTSSECRAAMPADGVSHGTTAAGSQPSPKRPRQAPLSRATPTRLFFTTTHVQPSPAVAVS